MLNSFEISRNVNKDYSHTFKMTDDLVMSYEHDNLFILAEKENKMIACYGYCFDVRNPQTNTLNTLNALLDNGDHLMDDVKYLNGHYILLLHIDDSWKLLTDAVGMTTVYYDGNEGKVSTGTSEQLPSLNGSLILNLEDFSLSRLEMTTRKLRDDRIERIILDLVSHQYKYFKDKELTLNFRRNRMNKALISILHPALFGNTLNLRETDNITKKLSNQLSHEYKLNVLSETEEPEATYMCNTHLMNYVFYMDRETGLDEESKQVFINEYKIPEAQRQPSGKIEYNLMNHLSYRSEQKHHLIYDPFNVLAIQKIIYTFNDSKSFDPLDRIIKILHPAIDFYDFAKGETLLQKYRKLKRQHTHLSKELKNHQRNTEFLNAAYAKGIKLSDNLDGKLLDDGITFYPVDQNISKDDIFEVSYKKQGHGMVLIESYFNNPRNAHRITVEINGEPSNIDEYLEGKFINVDSDLSLKMSYERDYDASSWQKAGKITIKEID